MPTIAKVTLELVCIFFGLITHLIFLVLYILGFGFYA